MNVVHVKLPSNNTRKYGHAPIGERAIKVTRYAENPNTTVNLLCSLTGPKEAYNSPNPVTLRPRLEVGDMIVMDNCPTDHHQGGRILQEFLDNLNIELVHMPAYSPDFNPAEYVFGKLKCLKESLYTAANFITPGDMHGFFRITGYLEV